MKKIVGIILTLVILGFFVNSFLETRTKEQTAKAERARFEHETIDAVNALVARTNAVRGWEMALGSDKAVRISPILTIELERVWVQPRPILFVGELQDIRGRSPSHYEVVIRHGFNSPMSYPISSHLVLTLKCDKGLVDAFLSAKQSLADAHPVADGVAVVAQIEHVKSGDKKSDEDEKIGVGTCVGLLPIGDVLLKN